MIEAAPALLHLAAEKLAPVDLERRRSLITAPPPLRGAGCLPICDFVLEEDEGPTSIRKLNRTRERAVSRMLHDLALAQTAEFHDVFQPQHLPRRFPVLLR
jgi:hypothetical protein